MPATRALFHHARRAASVYLIQPTRENVLFAALRIATFALHGAIEQPPPAAKVLAALEMATIHVAPMAAFVTRPTLHHAAPVRITLPDVLRKIPINPPHDRRAFSPISPWHGPKYACPPV